MIANSHWIRIKGQLLHRMVLDPEDLGSVIAVAIFYHGQGDYAERYVNVLDVFTRRGIRCVITELPGHGYSSGRRGHCGDDELLDCVVRDTLKIIGEYPYGVMGHSMGGLLALRHLILAGRDHYPMPDFAWLSSPLIHPGGRRSEWYKAILRFFTPIIPSLTVTTGVTSQMCHVKSHYPKQRPALKKRQLWHRRISLGWARALLDIEQLVRQHASDIPASVPVICTQGEDDPVCPAQTARDLFRQLPNTEKVYCEFEDMLHDPFNGEASDQLFAALETWLDGLDIK